VEKFGPNPTRSNTTNNGAYNQKKKSLLYSVVISLVDTISGKIIKIVATRCHILHSFISPQNVVAKTNTKKQNLTKLN